MTLAQSLRLAAPPSRRAYAHHFIRARVSGYEVPALHSDAVFLHLLARWILLHDRGCLKSRVDLPVNRARRLIDRCFISRRGLSDFERELLRGATSSFDRLRTFNKAPLPLP
jgi:hypothetical protein